MTGGDSIKKQFLKFKKYLTYNSVFFFDDRDPIKIYQSSQPFEILLRDIERLSTVLSAAKEAVVYANTHYPGLRYVF